MKRLRIGTALSMFTLLLSGCSALPDTTLGHKCGVPDGIGCQSTQAVYDRALAGDLPGLNRIDSTEFAPRHDRGAELPLITHRAYLEPAPCTPRRRSCASGSIAGGTATATCTMTRLCTCWSVRVSGW